MLARNNRIYRIRDESKTDNIPMDKYYNSVVAGEGGKRKYYYFTEKGNFDHVEYKTY